MCMCYLKVYIYNLIKKFKLHNYNIYIYIYIYGEDVIKMTLKKKKS